MKYMLRCNELWPHLYSFGHLTLVLINIINDVLVNFTINSGKKYILDKKGS